MSTCPSLPRPLANSHLGLFRFSEALAWTSIFPYAYSMVSSFAGLSQNNPALVVGLLVSVFTFCEFLTGTLWARVSDSIGRKPTLLMGAFAATLLAICFGFSGSVFTAVSIRALGGITNPNVGVVQTCVGELVRSTEHQGNVAAWNILQS